MKNSRLLLVLIPVTVLLAGGCSGGAKKGAGGGVPVLVAPALVTNLPVQIDPPPVGHVMAYSTVTIRPQVGGILQKIHFQEGAEVKSNALLFTIDPRPMQAALARDQALLENAEIQFNREQKLFDQKLISQDEYDTSRAGRDTLAATVQSDELNLSFTEIRAPFDGQTGGLQFHEGNVVKAPDDTLVTINQIHPIYVAFAVPEQFLPQIKREMREKTLKVAVTFQGMEVPPPQGELTFIDNTVDSTTGQIQLRATFPNEDSALWPGQFVQVALTLSELTNAIVVPSQAVQTGQNGQFIYVVKSKSTAGDPPSQTVEERPVVTGITAQGGTVVRSGVQAGETVVTDGQLRLAPGVPINVKTALLSTNPP
ncbi:MAG TPA: efflux RND transporter periplasmic adaptor subunit [Candidatus Acidoferrum sp.]|nr:efflux RND transporter periplasmic adaptor subunit [Candidatus Acidoferrum sp.]